MTKTETSLNASEFLAELDFVARAAARKTTVPVLANIHFSSNGRLQMTATDLELANSSACFSAVRVGPEQAVTVPAQAIMKLAKQLERKGKIALTLEPSSLTVRQGSITAKFDGLPATQFPELAAASGDALLKMEGGVLRRLIGQVKHCISSEESRFTLNGALLEVKDETLIMAATDGHRLALARSKGFTAPVDFRVLIPTATVLELERIPAESMLTLRQDESMLFFSYDGRTITARKLAGTFPDYERVIPKEYAYSVALDKASLLAAIKRARVFANERTRSILVEITDSSAAICVNHEGSAYNETITFDASTASEKIAACINGDYLAEAVKAVDFKWIQVHLPKLVKGQVIHAIGITNLAFPEQGVEVLMPQRP